jgi:N12 class adenine-specific DNA methylase
LTAKIASGQWDGIIVTHSSFERIGMSPEYQERFLRAQIAEYDQLLSDTAATDTSRGHRNLIKTLEKQKAAREARLKDLLAENKKDDGLVFDELGVDHVFVDEAHYFKNLETPTKMDRVAGIQTGGSQRAFDLFMKARYLDGLHTGHGVTFATGTPVSNTMVELYNLQRFLDPRGLIERGIEHFDAWAATFGEVIESMEISPDGASLRPRSRFARFNNLPDLQLCRRTDARYAGPSAAATENWQADHDCLPDVPGTGGGPRRTHPALRTTAYTKGRSARGQRPGHHDRWPQTSTRCPDARR